MINSAEIKRCVTAMIPENYEREKKYTDMKFLVLEHVKCKHKFTFPAGTCEPREREDDTLIREMMEELCLNLKITDLYRLRQRMAYYDRIDGYKAYLETTYIVDKGNQAITNMEPDKHPSFKWVSLEEIFNNPQEYTYNTWLSVAELLKYNNELNIVY